MITAHGAYVGGVFTPAGNPWESSADLLAAAHWARSANPGDFGVLVVESATNLERIALQSAFELEPLQMGDVANPRQRAKVEIGDRHVLCVLKSIAWDEVANEIKVHQVSVITGRGFALVFCDGGPADVVGALSQLQLHPTLSVEGPGSVLYVVMDAVVDHYVLLTDVIQTAVEDIETDVFNPNRQDSTARIYHLNRQNLEFRRAVHPLVPLGHDLSQRTLHAVPAGLRNQFADVGDHLLRVADSVDGFNNILLSMLMASTALMDLQQNRDVRKISAWVAIAAVPTAVAAIYGMNFDYMPELHWQFGYPMVLLVMATSCTLLWRAFKKSGWL
ncbi:MAG: magnesium and cobalt transport protein CorA [Actinobacteria bacterium]|nr:magnesium and cobalt transport protein CorA [Actinomycetota bacterium]